MSTDVQLMIDLIIPIHDPTRPLERAIRSVLDGGLLIGSELRITVVCHNVSEDDIRSVLSPTSANAVRFLECRDGLQSPAGPFTLGIQEAGAKYVSIMGSDDTLEPGALDAWLVRAERMNATVVIPPERHASGAPIRTPPTRPWRTRGLDGVKDRLAYRTAPLGLIRLEAIRRLGLTMPSRLKNGSDQLFGARLWFSDEKVVYGRGDPHYVVWADAGSRITFAPRPLEDELRAPAELIMSPWFSRLPSRAQRAIATKIVRVHVFSATTRRGEDNAWTDADRDYVRELLQRLRAAAPKFERSLSIADRRLVDALHGQASNADVRRFAGERRRLGHPTTLITRDLRGLLAVDGPLRFKVAAALL